MRMLGLRLRGGVGRREPRGQERVWLRLNIEMGLLAYHSSCVSKDEALRSKLEHQEEGFGQN